MDPKALAPSPLYRYWLTVAIRRMSWSPWLVGRIRSRRRRERSFGGSWKSTVGSVGMVTGIIARFHRRQTKILAEGRPPRSLPDSSAYQALEMEETRVAMYARYAGNCA